MIDSIDNYISQIQSEFKDVRYIKLVKSGKEAVVHLISVEGNLTALKVYKENIKFSSRGEYFDINEIGDSRLIRAAKKKTRTGIKVIKNSWINREYQVLDTLSKQNALVPFPIMNLGHATLMDYFGDIATPAPRLVDVNIPDNLVLPTLNIILDHIQLFCDLDFVHGDLSAYNILWENNLPFIIDFPQVIYRKNRNFKMKLLKDIENVGSYFRKYDIQDLDYILDEFANKVH